MNIINRRPPAIRKLELNKRAFMANKKITVPCRPLVIPLMALAIWLAFIFVCAAAAAADSAESIAPADLSRMSLEELTNIEISSVSKRAEPLIDAAASVYVISREDIRRYGATSIPEILRLAPNLQVAKVDSSQYAISARGFNSTTANKLLVLIDGRSVYTPLYSGVFWDVQDTMIEDIERIEVVSGPGGTLWGVNAVNGVINIITKSAGDTKGGLLSAGAGNYEHGGGVRYGGQAGENIAYRVYAKGFERDNTFNPKGGNIDDSWRKGQLGFRLDWGKNNDTLMLQGDAYEGSIDQKILDDKSLSGAHLLARWDKTLAAGSAVQIQAYFDQTRRIYPGTFGEVLNTYDITAQHRFSLGRSHDIVWGGGYRYARDDVSNSDVLAFLPGQRDLALANVFAQDTVTLTEQLKLTLGARLSYNNYTDLEVQPNIRLAWKPNEQVLLWSAISHAVRTPSRLDSDFFIPGNPPFILALAGGLDFQSEKLTAFELGYRMQPTPKSAFSISAFYNIYDELRSLEPVSASSFVIANMMEGDTYGLELWGSYAVSDWWQLKAGYTYLRKHLRLKPGSNDPFGAPLAGNDPQNQFSARSIMNLWHNVDLDLVLRTVDSLPAPAVPGYVTMDGRLGWKFLKNTELSLSGFNLLDNRHPEFGNAPGRSEIDRTFYVKVLWNF
ncbi:TonB-dependent receptor, plug [Candidatus Methylobacter favarea]|uniref:TonB-dependent receptor, plug n=1 Tax=Candidatus Methylobacter favarea TaxID=2707345 RepID=A0A8S0XSL6_9GAMM|nr:TonB-dependent receptor [Candidatus Methylobacter favarea]CAA9890862.1 TonB-dependent receptor, plug [Candidatus Methylobacter favarea]